MAAFSLAANDIKASDLHIRLRGNMRNESENIDFHAGDRGTEMGSARVEATELGQTATQLVIRDILRDDEIQAVFPPFNEDRKVADMSVEE